MSIVTIPSPIHREPELLGQTVVVIGGSSGIGFERHVVHAPDNHLDARAGSSGKALVGEAGDVHF